MQYPHRKKSPLQTAALWSIRLILGAAIVLGLYRCISRPPQIQETDAPVTPIVAEKTAETQTEQAQESTAAARQRREGVYIVLVSGLDDENGGSDTNLLVVLDTEREHIHVVSLPRDTLLNTSWKVKKLNNAYYNGGISSVQEQVSRLLGIPVDFYIVVDLDGFVKLVDAVGGVEFDVPVDMDYDDPYQDLHIHIPKGLQLLDGESAMKVVRWRQNNDGTEYATRDIGRIGTQQRFLKAAAKQILTPANLGRLPEMMKIFSTYVDTDLTISNLIWLGEQVLRIGTESLAFDTLPGDGAGYYKGTSYYTVDPAATLDLVNAYLNPYNEDLSSADLDILIP